MWGIITGEYPIKSEKADLCISYMNIKTHSSVSAVSRASYLPPPFPATNLLPKKPPKSHTPTTSNLSVLIYEDVKVLECIQRRATKLMKRLKGMTSHKKNLRTLGLPSWMEGGWGVTSLLPMGAWGGKCWALLCGMQWRHAWKWFNPVPGSDCTLGSIF